jgi:predicted enzyme related to lactoylglutathione lyase
MRYAWQVRKSASIITASCSNCHAKWSEHGATAHRGPKTIMTGERLCQMLDPFGNLFGLRQPPV